MTTALDADSQVHINNISPQCTCDYLQVVAIKNILSDHQVVLLAIFVIKSETDIIGLRWQGITYTHMKGTFSEYS